MSKEWPKKENENEKSEKENIKEALEKIRKSGIFNDEYLENISLVVFSMDGEAIELFEDGHTKSVDSADYSNEDFMRGKRVDFVGIHTRKDFAKINFEKLSDKQILPFIFFEGKLSYEEFLVHEMAHNVFDRKYKEKYGEFEEKNGITNVSEEYCEKISFRLEKLILGEYPDLDISKFNLQRQKIAEIFAMVYQRQFCKKNKCNLNLHSNVEIKIREFFSNPNKILEEFNKKNNRNCNLKDIYEENHILSLMVVPLIEKMYPNFEDRKKIFFEK